MPKINLKLSVLDTLFILVSSFTILLLIMWMAGQVIGTSNFSTLPSWTTGMMDKAWGFLTTGAASALLYWINRNKRAVPNYLFWILGTTLTLAVLLLVAVKLVGKPQAPAPVVTEAKIHFRLTFPDPPKSLAYIQQAPKWKNEIRNIMAQPTGYFQEYIDIPEEGKKFVAKLTPLIHESAFSDTAMQLPIEICFTRVKKEIPGDNILAILKCNTSRLFERENADPGIVQLCGPGNNGPTVSFSLFSSCYAQMKPVTPGTTTGWAVPNLNTLISEKKAGFSHVTIKSLLLGKAFATANRYSYAIKVNGNPIFIDGFQPKDLLQQFNFAHGLNLAFGLQNLGFSGENDGLEKIEITFVFYNNSQVVGQTACAFDYVALRSFAPQEVNTADGSRFQWEVDYKLPGQGVEFEVFNISSTDLQEIRRSKAKIDKAALKYEGKPIVGVIRPPLPPNKNYGVILGLEQPNKQIRFLYTQDEAKALINWAKQQPGNNFSRSIYLYRITNKQRATGTK